MSSICNRMMYDEGLGLLGPNKHGIRARRHSVRKQQLNRREDLIATELFDAKIHQIRCSDSLWKLSSASSSPVSSLACSHSRPRFMKEITASSSGSSKHQRFDMGTMEPFQDSIINSDNVMTVQSAGGLLGLSSSSTDSSFGSLSPSLSSFPQSPKWPAPLPPVLSRLNMPGSPLTHPGDNSYDLEYTFPQRPVRSTKHLYAAGSGGNGGGTGGARAMGMGMGGRGTSSGNGGIGSGNMDGDSPVASGFHPGHEGAGGNDDGDAEGGENEGGRLAPAPVQMPTPSSYTFRRRNAIVEGSEDAPKADDFPDLS